MPVIVDGAPYAGRKLEIAYYHVFQQGNVKRAAMRRFVRRLANELAEDAAIVVHGVLPRGRIQKLPLAAIGFKIVFGHEFHGWQPCVFAQGSHRMARQSEEPWPKLTSTS